MIFVVNKNATDQGIDPSEPATYTKGREFTRPSLVPPRMADLFVLYSVNHFLLCALNEANVIRYVINSPSDCLSSFFWWNALPRARPHDGLVL